MRKSLLGAVAVAALMLPGAALAQSGTIKIGILVALEGAFATGGQDGVRNVELALKQVNNTIAGKKIETVVAPTDTKPDTTVRMARKLIEQDKVDLIIGPLSGSEGIAMRDFAKTIPDKVVINGISGALETTWVDPAPNFYRFNLDGSQWGFGLGNYVVTKKGWKRVATIAADYSFGYTNFMGFAVDFCKSGGDIVQRFWQPLGQSDFGGIIAQLPDNVDAIYLGLGGTDAINFLNQYQQAGEKTRLIGGTIMADQTVLTAKGKAKDVLKGTPTSGPFAADNTDPAWTGYVKLYQDSLPRRPAPPIAFAIRSGLLRGHARRHQRARSGWGRSVERAGKVQGSAQQASARQSDRQDHAERKPAGDRNGIRQRSGRWTGRQLDQQDGRQDREREPDARHDDGSVQGLGATVARCG